jgi:hypothetical protein
MNWYAYLRRLAVELVIFLILTTLVFYIANGRESIAAALNMALIATLFYGGITFILRQRTLGQQDRR